MRLWKTRRTSFGIALIASISACGSGGGTISPATATPPSGPDPIPSLTANAVTKEGFELTFADEFDAAPLDAAIWHPGLPFNWNTISLNDEEQGYAPENIVVENGVAALVLERRAVSGMKNGTLTDFEYASGAISTTRQLYQKYGVFEVRAKLPASLGSWPAFWLMPENGNIYSPVGAEIDVFENLARWGDIVQFGLHYDGYGEDHKHFAAGDISVPDIFAEFHTYTLEWNPENTNLYIDGELRAEYSGVAVPTTEHYIILNAAMGGWGGDIDDAALPDRMEIDYVRVYQYLEMDTINAMEGRRLNP